MRVQPLHVHTSLVYPFVNFMAGNGGHLEHNLEMAGLPVIDYKETDSEVSEASLCDFVSHCANSDPSMEYGLEAAVATGLGSQNVTGLIHSDTSTWSVLNRICDQKNWLSPYPRYWLERDGEISWICRGPHIAPFDIRDIELFAVHRLVEVVRLLTGSNFVPPKVSLKTSHIGAIRNYPLLETTSLELNSPRTRIAIPHRILMSPARAVVDDDFLAAVRIHLEAVVASNRLPSIDDISESMGTSRRNLQRFLQARNTSFRMLHDEFVFKSARKIWRNTGATINETAIELGYSNHANFNRAIARIVGVTPTEFRTQVMTGVKVNSTLSGYPSLESRPDAADWGTAKAISNKEGLPKQSNTPRNFRLQDQRFPRSAHAGFSFKSTWLLNFTA